MSERKLWGGRFTGKTDPLMELYNASLPYDKCMYSADIEGTRVYTQALKKLGILTEAELSEIKRGLDQIEEEWTHGSFVEKGDEDIHSANERRLGEIIGSDIAGKVHTGRSRNDQVATDMRIYVRSEIAKIRTMLCELIRVMAERAVNEIDALMPGYTHLQRAQPIRWAHWISCHATYLASDLQRLDQVTQRVNSCPLGSGALAGHPFGVDRQFLASKLGFQSVIGNSLTAVSDRDFVVETLFWGSLVCNHLSKLSEDLILYCSAEFGFVKMADAYSTGSSLMPQKKNADSLELLRGKSGRVFGQLAGFMMTLKGTPTAYNKDLQEDKEPLFDCLKTVSHSLQIATGVFSTLTIDRDNMHKALTMDMLATDLADYLVRKGVPFRETHHISGEAVRVAEDLKLAGIDKLSLEQLQNIDSRFNSDVFKVFDFERSVECRTAIGGTARSAVLVQLKHLLELANSE